jgi:hypothetical protein
MSMLQKIKVLTNISMYLESQFQANLILYCSLPSVTPIVCPHRKSFCRWHGSFLDVIKMQLDEQIPRYCISSFSSAFPKGLGFAKYIFSVILSCACLVCS